MPLTALALIGTLKASPEPSSSELLAHQILDELRAHDVTGDLVRLVDLDIKPGVETDMGDGDEWPGLRDRLLKADILVVCTPIWMGQTPSTTHRLLERLDAELSETTSDGTPTLFGKVAIVGVVGNEDGAHHVTAELFQALNDVGFSIPAQGGTYWVGEAMGSVDYNDLANTPDAVADATATAVRNAVHVAELLQTSGYPAK